MTHEPPPKPDRHIVLLVDDQAIIGEAVRRILAPHADVEYHFCQDPLKAIEVAHKVSPTVILQDLVMPGKDGLDLVLEFRADETTREIPLIVLSSREEPVTKAEAFARGANDYLVKLPDPIEILARIRHHSRGYRALLERNAAYDALASELAQASDYVQSLLPKPMEDSDIAARGAFIPSASLGGDFFGWSRLPDGRVVVFLIDVCGHGVGPALLSVSVSNALTTGAMGVDPASPALVLERLNSAFPMTHHRGMYFTSWYCVIDLKAGTLTWAGGGHPPALLVRANGEIEELESQGTPTGMIPDVPFSQDVVQVRTGDRLFIYSDGIVELLLPSGTVGTHSEFRSFVASDAIRATDPIERMLAHARERQGGPHFADDVSVVEVTLRAAPGS
jgi:sigma-B regulation protein RsbU (phosphoserine phosphatase)